MHEVTLLRMGADDVEHLDALLTAVGEDDTDAFVEVYSMTITKVRARIRRVVLDATHSDDVTQDVYLELWRTAHRFDATLSPAITWILRLAHARAVDRVRRIETARRHEAGHPDRAGEPDRDLFAESEDRINAAQQIHAGLPLLSELQAGGAARVPRGTQQHGGGRRTRDLPGGLQVPTPGRGHRAAPGADRGLIGRPGCRIEDSRTTVGDFAATQRVA